MSPVVSPGRDIFAAERAGSDYFQTEAHYRLLANEIYNHLESTGGIALVTSGPASTGALLQCLDAVATGGAMVVQCRSQMSFAAIVEAYRHFLGMRAAADAEKLNWPQIAASSARVTYLLALENADLLSREALAALFQAESITDPSRPPIVLMATEEIRSQLETVLDDRFHSTIFAHFPTERLARVEVGPFIDFQNAAATNSAGGGFRPEIVDLIAAFADGDPAVVNSLAASILDAVRAIGPATLEGAGRADSIGSHREEGQDGSATGVLASTNVDPQPEDQVAPVHPEPAGMTGFALDRRAVKVERATQETAAGQEGSAASAETEPLLQLPELPIVTDLVVSSETASPSQKGDLKADTFTKPEEPDSSDGPALAFAAAEVVEGVAQETPAAQEAGAPAAETKPLLQSPELPVVADLVVSSETATPSQKGDLEPDTFTKPQEPVSGDGLAPTLVAAELGSIEGDNPLAGVAATIPDETPSSEEAVGNAHTILAPFKADAVEPALVSSSERRNDVAVSSGSPEVATERMADTRKGSAAQSYSVPPPLAQSPRRLRPALLLMAACVALALVSSGAILYRLSADTAPAKAGMSRDEKSGPAVEALPTAVAQLLDKVSEPPPPAAADTPAVANLTPPPYPPESQAASSGTTISKSPAIQEKLAALPRAAKASAPTPLASVTETSTLATAPELVAPAAPPKSPDARESSKGAPLPRAAKASASALVASVTEKSTPAAALEPVAPAAPSKSPAAQGAAKGVPLPPAMEASDPTPIASVTGKSMLAVAPEPATPAASPSASMVKDNVVASIEPTPATPPAGAQQPLARDELRSAAAAVAGDGEAVLLVRRGDQLMSIGDITSARSFFELAVNKGDVSVATRIAKTYDPFYLQQSGVRGVVGNAAKAMAWYRKGVDAGDMEAVVRLKVLQDKHPE